MLLSVAVLFRLRRCQPICLLCSFLPWFIPLGRRALCREIHSSSQWNFQEKVDKLFRILAPVFLLGLLLSTLPLRVVIYACKTGIKPSNARVRKCEECSQIEMLISPVESHAKVDILWT